MESKRRAAIPLFGILAAAALLYAISASAHFVGHFSDDARDILAAQSLWHGSYSNLQIPGHPPLNFPLPGFPLLLTPFIGMVGGHYGWLRAVPIFFTLLGVIFADRLFRFPSFGQRLAFILLFAFNPMTVFLSGSVIADTAYLSGLLAAFLLMDRQIERESVAGLWGLAAVLAMVCLLRPEGIFADVAIGLTCLTLGRKKLVVIGAGLPLVPWLAVMLRNQWLTGRSTGYLPIWSDAASFLAGGYHPLAQHVSALIETTFVKLIYGIAWPPGNPWRLLVLGVIIVGTVALMGRGFWVSLERKKSPPPMIAAITLYGVFHLVLHIAWPVADLHYMWPLLPFLLYFLLQGLGPFRMRRLGPAIGIAAGALIVAALYAWQAVAVIRTAADAARRDTLPMRTFNWIRTQTPPDAFFLAPTASVVTLYTGRHALTLIRAQDIDDLRYQMLRRGLTHVIVSPVDFLYVQTAASRDPQEAWRRIAADIPKSPDAFELVFRSQEPYVVYRVIPSEPFRLAYADYKKALERLQQNDADGARRLLTQSVRRYPLAPALNALALDALFHGGNLLRADAQLDQALKLRPDFALAWANRARLAVRRRKPADAKRYYEEAVRRIQRTGEFVSLLPLIEQESVK